MILLLNINSKTFVFLSSRGHNGDFSSLSASPRIELYRCIDWSWNVRFTTCFHQFLSPIFFFSNISQSWADQFTELGQKFRMNFDRNFTRKNLGNISLVIKGDVISDFFSIWLNSPNKKCHYTRKDAQVSNLAPFCWDLSQSEKLFEMKPPLLFSW